MRIIEKAHKFTRSPAPRLKTEKIVIHHSASPDVSSETIHQWHLGRGWIGIGYQFVIRMNGDIERGRPMNSIGTHALSPANETTVGICLTGNFENAPPSIAQMNSLTWLIKEVVYAQYGELPLTTHKDWANTACPGKLFPMAKLLEALKAPVEVYNLIINNRKVTGYEQLHESGRTFVQLEGRNGTKVWVSNASITKLAGGTIKWDGPKNTVTINIPGPSGANLMPPLRF